jgi:CheY-like chemotaxis protein
MTAPRVLLVDDNVSLQEALASILADAGCEIRAASDGMEALEEAERWQPNVIFIDVNMPGLSGFEVAEQLRKRHPAAAMKLVLMSAAKIDPMLSRQAQQAGFDACMDKMSDPADWLRHVRVPGAS